MSEKSFADKVNSYFLNGISPYGDAVKYIEKNIENRNKGDFSKSNSKNLDDFEK